MRHSHSVQTTAAAATTTQNPSISVTDWRYRSIYHRHRIQVIVLHDTEVPTAEGTVDVLNQRNLSVHYIAGVDGTIYYLVDETERAYHAGISSWGSHVGLNDASIGIEIVNTGVDIFPDVQVKAVAALCRKIIDRWNISPQDIVAHGDIAPSRKHDVSGWFNWTMFYSEVGLFPGLFVSNITTAQQQSILLSTSANSTVFDAKVQNLQQRLSDYGYVSAIDVNGYFDTKTEFVVEAFNRHFCPEFFVKEGLNSSTGDYIPHPENRRWYGISEERLTYLLENTVRDLCAQC
uniref:N-acetylmuramoyl-L-alanine amidase n=1 Tax=Plectus sambesii TaxID=2011161 RepID=A0A914VF95_9BILA